MSAPAVRAQGVVRRWIIAVILFVLVCFAASGVSGLLGELFALADPSDAHYWLPSWLAYAFIAGPLAVLIWWFAWRRQDAADRDSVAWALYVSAMYLLALVIATTSLTTVAAAGFEGRWEAGSAGTAVSWLIVALLHRLMLRHRAKGPTRGRSVPLALGAAWGLAVAGTGAGLALERLFTQALSTGAAFTWGPPWWAGVLAAVVTAVIGKIVWWWHWYREGVRDTHGGFADVTILTVGTLLPAAAGLWGVGTVLFVALRVLSGDVLDETLLARGAAAALVGLAIWFAHRHTTGIRPEPTPTAARLIVSAVALIGAASGLGVIVNALLATTVPLLGGTTARELLWAGLAALVVGGVTWVLAWRPLSAAERVGNAAYRVYLVVVFGASAVVAVSTLVFIGYRIFELALEPDAAFLERVRAPLGLLLATALVAGYHFALWRRDRAVTPAEASVRRVEEVVLVAAGEVTETATALRAATGARVQLWARADAAAAPDADTVLAALAGIEARRVLVIAGETLTVIPLAE